MAGTRYLQNDELRATISWRIRTLAGSVPRRVWFFQPKPVGVYTDASGGGHVGVTIHYDGSAYCTATHLPHWIRTAKAKTADYELRGSVLGACVARALFPDMPVLLFCDNQGARGAINRGSCKTSHGRALAAISWIVSAENGHRAWTEYVRSKENQADPV